MTTGSNLRKPAVAGQFYPSSARELKDQIGLLIDPKAAKMDVIACMLPHAGYVYSGAVAAKTVSGINIKDTVILLGPNHTGLGAAFSIMAEGAWQTPLGEVKIDAKLAALLMKQSRYLEEDALAHLHEHSLEVELPFLQYFRTDFQIVPIAVMGGDTGVLVRVGAEIASAVKDNNLRDSVMIVASSDMTHYEAQAQAEAKDKQAIEAILRLNEDELMDRVSRYDISMCGSAPVTVMLSAAKMLGARNARLVKYQTSGDVTGDKSSVVGYAGIVVY